jgi:hypothetical protein
LADEFCKAVGFSFEGGCGFDFVLMVDQLPGMIDFMPKVERIERLQIDAEDRLLSLKLKHLTAHFRADLKEDLGSTISSHEVDSHVSRSVFGSSSWDRFQTACMPIAWRFRSR